MIVLSGVFDPPNVIFPTPTRKLLYYIYAWIYEKSLLTDSQWNQLGETGILTIIEQYYNLLTKFKPFTMIGDNPTKDGYKIITELSKNKTYDMAKYIAVLKSLSYAVKYGHVEPKYITPTPTELNTVKKVVEFNFWESIVKNIKSLSIPVIGAGALVIYFLIKPYVRK